MHRYLVLFFLFLYHGCIADTEKIFFYTKKQQDPFYQDKNSIENIFEKKTSSFHLASDSIHIYTDEIIKFYYPHKSNMFQRFGTESNVYFTLYKKDNPWNPIVTIHKKTPTKQKGVFFQIKDLEENNYTLYIQKSNSKREVLLKLYVREYKDAIDYDAIQ